MAKGFIWNILTCSLFQILSYFLQSKYESAEICLEEVVRDSTEISGAKDLTLKATNLLGKLYANRGETSGAEILLTRTLKAFEQLYGTSHSTQRKYVSAEALFSKALTGLEAQLGKDHPKYLTVLLNRGTMHRVLGKLQSAETMLLKALRGFEEFLGPDHRKTLAAVVKLDQAKATLVENLETRDRLFGRNDYGTMRPLYGLWRVYTKKSMFEDAKRMLARATEASTACNHTDVNAPNHCYDFGIHLRRAHRYLEAERFLNSAAEGYEWFFGAVDEWAIKVRTKASDCQTLQRRGR